MALRHRNFRVLGFKPTVVARCKADDSPSETQPVVISHGLWQRRFKGDASVVGQTLKLNGQIFSVVGVMEKSFRGLRLGVPPDFGYRWPQTPATQQALEAIAELS